MNALTLSHRLRGRAVTLVELLIALVLVLAMGALIFPSLMDSLDERSFETAADVTNEQLMMARAHAQATGTPVEVTYSPAKSQVQARLFSPFLTDFADLGSSSAAGESTKAPSSSTESSGTITQAWATRALGKSVRIVARSPMETTEEIAVDPFAETFENFGQGQDVRLAVFMPDGSALVNQDVWLNDDKGRWGVFQINPWSGLPLFKRLADLSAKASEAQAQNAASPKENAADVENE